MRSYPPQHPSPPAPPSFTCVPREGLAHPVFDGMGPADDLIVNVIFAEALDDERKAAVEDELHIVAARAPRANPAEDVFRTAQFEPYVNRVMTLARFMNLRDPRGVADVYLRRLEAIAPIQEAWLARWATLPNGLMGPVPDPRALAGVPGNTLPSEVFLSALWNVHGPPPASEIDEALKGAFVSGEDVNLELRGMPPFFPGFRISYGTVGLSPDTNVRGDARSASIAHEVTAALDTRWREVWSPPGRVRKIPRPANRDGDEGAVDTFMLRNFRFYTFMLDATDLLLWPTKGCCRFRDAEVFEAIAWAIQRTGLAPVITWEREGTELFGPLTRPDFYIFQLWEQPR